MFRFGSEDITLQRNLFQVSKEVSSTIIAACMFDLRKNHGASVFFYPYPTKAIYVFPRQTFSKLSEQIDPAQ